MCVFVMKVTTALLFLCVWLHAGLSATQTGVKCGVPQGRSLMDGSLRIVGGTEARYGSHPWLVSLRTKGSHFCGGSILTDRWILTAAHCFTAVSKQSLSNVRVVVGEFNQKVHEDEEQIFLIKTITIHEKYQHALPMTYDIALLELDGHIQLGSHVQPICLPLPDESFPPKTRCIVGGWGRMKERGHLPAVLREVQLDLVEPSRCKHVLQTVRTSLQNPGPARSQPAFTVLCAGPERGGKDACQGDSGGPLVCPLRGHSGWVVVGVTSWGKGCGRSWGNNSSRPPSRRGSPGVFTDVRLLLPWIKSKLREADGKHKGRMFSRPCSVRDGHVTSSEGVIRIPALPGHHYDNNELCSWFISVPAGHSVLLEFYRFDLENDSYCHHDRLTVSIATHRPVGTFCGSVPPGPVLLNNSQSATLLFSSDVKGTGTGFVVRHRAVRGHHSGPGCGTVLLVEEQSVIQSPNYPESYSNNSLCHWVIYAPRDHVVKLDLVDFELEESEGCLYDSLSVLGDVERTEQLALLCGRSRPPPVLSYSNVMVLQFSSDSSVTHRGFRATLAFISLADLNDQETAGFSADVCGMPHVPAVDPDLGDDGPPGGEGPRLKNSPWNVHLHLDMELLCYGVLIHTRWVLTAAHCLIGLQDKSFSRLSVVMTGAEKQRFDVSRVILHPHYDFPSRDHDAALLQLSSPRCLTEHAQTVCLPNQEEEREAPPFRVCTVSGWAEPTGDSQNITAYDNEVLLMTRAECESHDTGGLPDTMLCVTPTPHGHRQDYCMGDRGAALVCQRADSSHVLLGVRGGAGQVEPGARRGSRGGEGCGSFQKPAVFTSVAALRVWIQEQIHARLDPAADVKMSPQEVLDLQEAVEPRTETLGSEDEDSHREASGWWDM